LFPFATMLSRWSAPKPTGVSSLTILCAKGVIVMLFLWMLTGVASSFLDVINERQNVLAHLAEVRAIYVEQCTNSNEVNQSVVRASECAGRLELLLRHKRRGAWNIALSNYGERRRWCGDIGCETYFQDSMFSLGNWLLFMVCAATALLFSCYLLVNAVNRWSQNRMSANGLIDAYAMSGRGHGHPCLAEHPPSVSLLSHVESTDSLSSKPTKTRRPKNE